MNNTTQDEQEVRPASWPLLFSFKSRVVCQGYTADIELCGRLLAELEMEGVWLYGVNPGALSVGAATLSTANVDLHAALQEIFKDFAAQATEFSTFKAEVERFFNESDPLSVAEWEGAVARVRCSTTIEVPGGLPILDAMKTRIFVKVAEPVKNGDQSAVGVEPVVAVASQLARAA